jgi:hypothetical protein
LISKIQKL